MTQINLEAQYKRGLITDRQMVRLVRLGILGNTMGITQEEFERITGKKLDAVISLEEVKHMQHGTVNGYRESCRMVNTVTYMGDEFEVNRTSQSNLTAMVLSALLAKQGGAPDSTTYTYRSATNTDHEFTFEQLVGLSVAMITKISQIYEKSWTMKTEIDNAKTVADALRVTADCGDINKGQCDGNGSICMNSVAREQ